jgi:hypothetical protein
MGANCAPLLQLFLSSYESEFMHTNFKDKKKVERLKPLISLKYMLSIRNSNILMISFDV